MTPVNKGKASRDEWPEVTGTECLVREAEKIKDSPEIIFVSKGSAAETEPSSARYLTYVEANAVGESIVSEYDGNSIFKLDKVYDIDVEVVDHL